MVDSLEQLALPAAVLWDMDGTLVDTEAYWIAAEHALVEKFGGTWTNEYAHELVGQALEFSAQLIIDRTGIDLSVTEIIEALLVEVIAQVKEHVPWRPGARELLAELNELGVPNLLVTMSWLSLAEAVVAGLPEGSFTELITGDSVTHGKPHPEPYLAAAELAGVTPGQCIALEDSPTGVRSATAAGVPTIAIEHIVPIPAVDGSVKIHTLAGVQAADLVPLVNAVAQPN